MYTPTIYNLYYIIYTPTIISLVPLKCIFIIQLLTCMSNFSLFPCNNITQEARWLLHMPEDSCLQTVVGLRGGNGFNWS